MEVREDDEEFKIPVDLMFDELESRNPSHFAVRQLVLFILADGKVAGIPDSSSSNIKSTGFLNSSSSSRTSIALMNSMRVEKFCSSTGAS